MRLYDESLYSYLGRSVFEVIELTVRVISVKEMPWIEPVNRSRVAEKSTIYKAEVSSGHSSQLPNVMVGTRRRTKHRTGKNPIEFVNYNESEQRSNMRHVVEQFNPNENLLERIISSVVPGTRDLSSGDTRPNYV